MGKPLFCLAAALRQGLRPGKKILYKAQSGILHVLGDLRQQMFQILINLQVVVLGGFHQAVDRGTGLCTVDGVNDVPAGPANGKGADGSLCRRIINGDLAVFQKYPQIFYWFMLYFRPSFVFSLTIPGRFWA